MPRRTLVALVSAALIASLAAVGAPAASAAPEAPLQPWSVVDGDGDVQLSWPSADGASAYSVQVASDQTFASGSLVTTVSTFNRTWVLPHEWSTGAGRTLYWRVASYGSATTASTLGAYSEPVQLDLEPSDVPALTGPGSPLGGTVTYPDPVVFEWQPVAGAQLYRLQYASDAAFSSDLQTVTTTATSYAPAAPLAREAGGAPITWHWRVQSVNYTGTTSGVAGAYSQPWTFRVDWPAETAQPTLLSPASWTPGAPGLSDIKLTWTPVDGASKYEVVIGVARSDDGLSVTSPITTASGITPFTTWVPTVTFTDRNLFWQVIPYDRAGNRGTASEVWQFRKLWGGQTGPQTAVDAAATYPEPLVGGTPAAPQAMSIDDFELSWAPVPRATLYEVQVVPTNGNARLTCRTASTSATIIGHVASGSGTPEDLVGQSTCLWNSNAAYRVANGGTYTWRVRAVDYSGDETTQLAGSNPTGTLVSAWSDPEEEGQDARERWITVTAPHASTATTAEPDTAAWAGGSAVAGQPSPVFSWNSARYLKNVGTVEAPDPQLVPVDGYEVTVALNPDMTNVVSITRTPSTRLRINGVFGDNETGMPYYWQVRPLLTSNWTNAWTYTAGGSATKPSWTKASTATSFYPDPTLSQTTSADGTITFAWQPQAVTGRADGGSRGYQVSVTTSAGQSKGTQKVEYPYFVALDPITKKPLANGSYKLKVAPLDANGTPGRPSPERDFTVATPAPSAHTARAAAGSAQLAWSTDATATRFELQYWNVASPASVTSVSAVGATNLTQTAYTVADLGAGTYAWRVRSVDAAGNASGWSTDDAFTIAERRPPHRTELDQVLPSSNRVLDWEPVAGVSRYLVQVATTSGGLTAAPVVETVASSFAPTTAVAFGTPYYWRVRAVAEKYGTTARPILGESAEGLVYTKTPPAAPTAGTPTLSTDGLTFTWTPLTGAGTGTSPDEPLEYVVRYRVKQTPEVEWTLLSPSTATSIAVMGLMTSTIYQFEVAGLTSEGQGAWSKTQEKATVSVPGSPTGLVATSKLDSIDVSWTRPTSAGTPLTAQVLRYRLTSDDTWTTVALSASAARYTITGLSGAQTYRIEVAGVSLVGEGAPAATEQIAVGRAGAPQQLVATRGDRQVKLAWQSPASLGGDTLTDYAVQMRTYSTTTKTWSAWTTRTTTSARSATVLSLTNGVKHEFRVYARTVVAGDGLPSAAVAATPAGKPSAPTGVKAVAYTGKVVVSWTKPATNGSTLSGYQVKYSLNGTTWYAMPKVAATTTSTTLKTVKGKTYWFRVTALSNIGSSPASATVKVVAK